MKCWRICGFKKILTTVIMVICLQSTSFAVEEITSQQDYLIGAEDVLEVVVWKNPDLSRQVNVRPDGMITLPLIGDVKAAGLTTEALRKTVVERLKEYQENATVSIVVKDINSYKVFVLGEVVRPGVYSLKSKTTLLQALAIAGGFTQFASKNSIVLIRDNKEKDGNAGKLTLSLKEIVKDGSPDKNPVLVSGDTIFVP